MSYRIEALGKHDRKLFCSGSEPLDRYFRERATQDARRRVASCFVAVAEDGGVAGFYTLAATSLLFGDLSPERAKKLPHYPLIPAVLLGRLAVDQKHRGFGLGGALVVDALRRATLADIAAYAVVVDAKDDDAARFYRHLGFEPLPDEARRLIRSLGIPASAH
jgi:GNAT superfamily N-acetyltransferase